VLAAARVRKSENPIDTRYRIAYCTGMKQTTGQRIRALRKKRRQTQVELAQAAKIGQATVSDWEKDLRRPSKRLLARLASALKVAPERIVR